MQEKRYGIEDLLYLMQRLRDPQKGCPWDVKQTFTSIIPSTLEEIYEVVDALEKNDMENLREELGDVLLHLVFYSQMAAEQQHFTFADVAHGIVEKLVRRHPHVFPSGNLYEDDASQRNIDEKTLFEQWDRIKQEEKQQAAASETSPGALSGIPRAMPAMQRSYKIQKKLAGVGFDWKNAAELLPIIDGELQELREGLQHNDIANIEEELGDVLFTVVNLARHAKVDPETALRHANQKVERRFAFVEAQLKQQGRTPVEATLDEMETLWQLSKQSGR
jgi:ATP diphosphatase